MVANGSASGRPPETREIAIVRAMPAGAVPVLWMLPMTRARCPACPWAAKLSIVTAGVGSVSMAVRANRVLRRALAVAPNVIAAVAV